MGKYLVQVAYTPDSWAGMVKDPQNRQEAVRPTLKALGGDFTEAWFTFGDYDLVGIVELPDDVSAGAFAMAVAAKGSCSKFVTTPLISMEDGMEAMRKAGKLTYTPPAR